MNIAPMLADIPWMSVIVGVGSLLFVFFIFVIIYASRYTKSGPNQVLVISGIKRKMTEPDGSTREVGFRIVKGGGRFVWPDLRKGGHPFARTADD